MSETGQAAGGAVIRWRCVHQCGREVSDNFYQNMIKKAKHPPLCVCRYSFNGGWNPPWSRWEEVVIRPERGLVPETDEAADSRLIQPCNKGMSGA